VWRPADNLDWQDGALCSLPEQSHVREWFFSKDTKQRYAAKNLCFECPVRGDCLQWALEHRMIWGVWGGRDEVDLRRALSVSHDGEETRRRRFPNCPYCGARPSKLSTGTAEVPGGGRWTTARIVTCSTCDFSWRSRTSANAVDTYHAERAERAGRRAREKERASRVRRTSKSSGSASS
jgi:WhiB family redox-sensing transcriptional regulator